MLWNRARLCVSILCATQRKISEISPIRKGNFRAAISEAKSWKIKLSKFLMLYRASLHQSSGKSPSIYAFVQSLPHIELDSSTLILTLDCERRSKCDLYQAHLKDYHDGRQHAELHRL